MQKPSPFRHRNSRVPLKEPLGDNAGLLITLSDITLLLLCCLVIWHVMDKQEALRRMASRAAIIPAAIAVLPASEAALAHRIELVPPISTLEEETTTVAQRPNDPFVPNRWELLKTEIQSDVAASGFGDGIGMSSTQRELFVALQETLLFDSGKADLNPSSVGILEKVAMFARKHADLDLEVLGHTDEVPIATAEFPSNWELSAARASRVARHLVTAGVAPLRISAQGYASFRPLVPNDNPQNRTANRRVEIRFYQPGRKGADSRSNSESEKRR